jgi:hypothetical protein
MLTSAQHRSPAQAELTALQGDCFVRNRYCGAAPQRHLALSVGLVLFAEGRIKEGDRGREKNRCLTHCMSGRKFLVSQMVLLPSGRPMSFESGMLSMKPISASFAFPVL